MRVDRAGTAENRIDSNSEVLQYSQCKCRCKSTRFQNRPTLLTLLKGDEKDYKSVGRYPQHGGSWELYQSLPQLDRMRDK